MFFKTYFNPSCLEEKFKLGIKSAPGQFPWRHGRVSSLGPWQSDPPLEGEGELQYLILVWVPVPQVTEQAPHCFQSPNWPFTFNKNSFRNDPKKGIEYSIPSLLGTPWPVLILNSWSQCKHILLYLVAEWQLPGVSNCEGHWICRQLVMVQKIFSILLQTSIFEMILSILNESSWDCI